jgi:hypothetical protein
VLLGFQPAIGAEVVPERLHTVLPHAIEPLRLRGRVRIRGRETGIAEPKVGLAEVGRIVDAAASALFPVFVAGVAGEGRKVEVVVTRDAHGIGEGAGDRDIDRLAGLIAHLVAEHSCRDAR